MTEQWTWEPVDDQENGILAAANHILRQGHPPVGECLCRRVPAPAQGVPVDVRDTIRGALLYQWDNERWRWDEGQPHIDAALAWLDAQAETQEEAE